jgi:hypothetical protein
VAQVKGQSQANIFFNGSTISSDWVIKTTENKTADKPTTSAVETIESIKENAMGFVKSMELLTNFDNTDGKRMVFIFYKEMTK